MPDYYPAGVTDDYGSDGPYGYPDETGQYDHGAILREVVRLPLTKAEREMVLADNFRRLVER